MQQAITLQKDTIVRKGPPLRGPARAVRRSEQVIIGFFGYVVIVAAILNVPQPIRYRIAVMNLSVLSFYALLVRAGSSGRFNVLASIVRDWVPFPLILLAYCEMGWFGLPHHGHPFEAHWIVLDRRVLSGAFKIGIEALGPILPAILEMAYSSVYVLGPFSIAMLYVYRRRESVDRFLFLFTIGVLLCYAQFPFWPSEPPRLLFPGDAVPTYSTVFRRFNWWMLGQYGIHTSVFPSAHVAGAFAAGFGMWHAMPERNWIRRFLLVMAVLIALATVYGRYHYLADAIAGFLMATLALGVTLWKPDTDRTDTRWVAESRVSRSEHPHKISMPAASAQTSLCNDPCD